MRHKLPLFLRLEATRFFRTSHHLLIPFLVALWVILVFSLARLGTQVSAADTAYMNYALLWLCAGLSLLLGADRLFDADHKNGLLEQIFLGPSYFIILARVLLFAGMHGLFFCLICLPILGLLLGMPAVDLFLFAACFLLGLPAFCMTLALGAAIGGSSSVRDGVGFIPALVSLPLYVPVVLLSMLALTEPAAAAFFMQCLLALSLTHVALLGLAVNYILRDAAAN